MADPYACCKHCNHLESSTDQSLWWHGEPCPYGCDDEAADVA